MVKDHSYSEGANPLPPLHGLRFLSNSKGYFVCTDRMAYTISLFCIFYKSIGHFVRLFFSFYSPFSLLHVIHYFTR